MRALLLNVRSRNNLSRKMKPLPQIIEALRGEGIIIVLPGKAGFNISAGSKRLASFDHLLIKSINVRNTQMHGDIKSQVDLILHRGSWYQCRHALAD